MNPEFQKIISRFPRLLKELRNSPPRYRDDLGNFPEKGIYVFYENKHPIYVGRSNRMKARIQQHGRQSSTHNSVPFAFNLAKEIARGKGIKLDGFRVSFEKDLVFKKLFSEAKERVSKMPARVIEITNPTTQALFEIYVFIALETRFNDFDTH